MERRKAVIAAATASLTLAAGAVAIGLNTSLVGASANDGVGEISPVDPATSPSTIYIDDTDAGRATPVPSGWGGDDEDELDDEFEDQSELEGEDHRGDGGDDAYEDDDHEYEGADDDD